LVLRLPFFKLSMSGIVKHDSDIGVHYQALYKHIFRKSLRVWPLSSTFVTVSAKEQGNAFWLFFKAIRRILIERMPELQRRKIGFRLE
jgi:hypothetical protein